MNNETKDYMLHKSIWECALMVEKYHYTVFFNAAGKLTKFLGEDMKKWKEDFYPNLIKTKIIHDSDFFDPNVSNPNIGAGADGEFTRTEYTNLRYQLYKFLFDIYAKQGLKEMFSENPIATMMVESISMLNPYIEKFNPKNPNQLITLEDEAMKNWKEVYFPKLVLTSLLNDYTIMDPVNLQKHMGIGSDGIATCCELQYFVSEACHYLLVPLYVYEMCQTFPI